MFGWRGRIGVISTELVKRGPCEFYEVAPKGVAYIVIGLSHSKEADTKNLERAINELTAAGVDCIIFSCTGRVTRETHGTEDELKKLIEDISGKPAITTISAAVEAMQHLAIKKILLSGHSDHTSTSRLKDYFEKRGFEVPFTNSLENSAGIKQEISNTFSIAKPDNTYLSDDLCYTQAIGAFRRLPSENVIDGIYIPCAQWTTHKYLNKVEKDSGKPVIGTHRSNVWWAFKTLGIKGPIHGYGKLLESL